MITSYVAPGMLFLVAALTMSGCSTEGSAGAEPESSSAPTMTESLTPTASPAPTEAVTPSASAPAVTTAPSTAPATPAPAPVKPAPDFLVVSTEGVGPLVIGATVPSAPAKSAVVAWDGDYCVSSDHPDIVVGGPFAGAWVPQYAKTKTATGGTRFPFEMVTKGSKKDAAITMIYVWSPLLSTTQGIHPGSTVAELKAVYGSDAAVNHFTSTDVYTVTGPTARMSFEVAVDEATAGKAAIGTVLWLTVYDSATKPFAMAGTDSGTLC